MASQKIVNALIVCTNSEDYSIRYGGETLLNRCLIALSKSDIKNAVILCRQGTRGEILESISKVNPSRLELTYDIRESLSLKEDILSATDHWTGNFLILESRILLHPTMVKQLIDTSEQGCAIYDGVTFHSGKISFVDGFKEKFKVIFSNHGRFRVSEDGSILIDVAVVSKDFVSKASFTTYYELIGACVSQLKPLAVREAWWAKVAQGAAPASMNDIFWKIAFKEISGEFSKAVNSKLSRHLSFWFADLGVAPNSISNVSVVLFLIASSLLLVPAYWAIVTFAVIWQFTAGILDRCDGEIARIRNYETESGGRFDMIIDDLRFGLPFIFLAVALYFQTGNILYLVSSGAAFSWSMALTLYEQNYMRKAGYVSRQVMYVDYLKLKGEKSQATSFLKKFGPIAKGDIRTFYVFLLCLFGYKEAAFWTLLAYLTLVPISSFVGILKFNKESAKKKGSIV